MVGRIEEELGEAKLLATGGLAHVVVPFTETIDEVDDLLTLKGLRLIYERNNKRPPPLLPQEPRESDMDGLLLPRPGVAGQSLTAPFEIGGVRIANRVLLAPLAGIGNWFVRLQAKRHGAGLAVSEMVSSFGLHHRNERTLRELMRIHPDEHPVSIQLFGHDPEVMRSGAAIAAEAGADLIDINMGCPVREGAPHRRRRRAAARPRAGSRPCPSVRPRAAACR